MKKQEILLTSDEKINLLSKAKTRNSLDYVKALKKALKILHISATALIALGVGTFIGLLMPPITTILFAATFISLAIVITFPISYLISDEINKISNGKITYKQFKQLVKSGELAKWEEQFKDRILEHQKNSPMQDTKEFKDFLEKNKGLYTVQDPRYLTLSGDEKQVKNNNTSSNQSNDLQR